MLLTRTSCHKITRAMADMVSGQWTVSFIVPLTGPILRFVKVKLALNVCCDYFVTFQDSTFNQLTSASQFLPLVSMIMCAVLFTFPPG